MKDFYERELKVGDWIAGATLSYRSAYLRVGKIVKFNEKGSITIESKSGMKYRPSPPVILVEEP